ncbi:hypothetical protein Q5P01_000450 [Channa striata]|uniref:TNFR-Cys domain-containing protein n=1 Tax=Channa striata TaxID=64152 RepID=A0AA88IGU7_CHASR|nr:hypothetical protein Q5P01_000450 [Channa striata]
MTLRASVTVASFLILVMKIFSGHCLTCHRSEYVIGNECCPKCLPGSRVKTDCTEFRSTSCLACLDGTYMNQPNGRKYCLSCTNCKTGSGLRIKTSCRTTSDAVCEPLDGFYCVDSTENSCVRATKHRSCEPGQYVSSKGTASSDTLCSRCPDGTFSDGTLTLCRPHTQCESQNLQLIKAGNAAADAECGEKSSNRTRTLVGAIVFVVFILILGAVLFLLYERKWNRNPNKDPGSKSKSNELLLRRIHKSFDRLN